jgi:hypothetical protein
MIDSLMDVSHYTVVRFNVTGVGIVDMSRTIQAGFYERPVDPELLDYFLDVMGHLLLPFSLRDRLAGGFDKVVYLSRWRRNVQRIVVGFVMPVGEMFLDSTKFW